MGTIRLKLGDASINAEVLKQAEIVSRHTGKNLAQVEARFTANEKHHDELQELLSQNVGTIISPSGDKSTSLPVRLEQTVWSSRDGDARRTYIWTLTETEELKLQNLQIETMTLEPYRYEEEFTGDALIITIRLEIDVPSERALRGLPQYFEVIRHGISDKPRLMRFGQFVWASVNDHHVRLHATLVDRSFDKTSNSHGIMDPEFGNLMRTVAATSERFKVLGDLLVAKGVLTEQDKAQFIDVEDHAIRERLHQLQRVADIDRWFDGESDTKD